MAVPLPPATYETEKQMLGPCTLHLLTSHQLGPGRTAQDGSTERCGGDRAVKQEAQTGGLFLRAILKGAHTLAVRGSMVDAGRHGMLGKLSNHWGPWPLGTPRGEGRAAHATRRLPVPQTVISSLREGSWRPLHGVGPEGPSSPHLLPWPHLCRPLPKPGSEVDR